MSTNNPAAVTRVTAPSAEQWESSDSTSLPVTTVEIEDPMMICPVCEDEFSATGMRWLGAFDVAKLTDKEIHEMAEQINNVWFPDASDDRLQRYLG